VVRGRVVNENQRVSYGVVAGRQRVRNARSSGAVNRQGTNAATAAAVHAVRKKV